MQCSKSLLLLALILLIGCNQTEEKPPFAAMETLYVGTFSNEAYILNMNKNTGKLDVRDTINNVFKPSYLTLHPNKKHLYITERAQEGETHGWVSAYRIDEGKVERINRVSSQGKGPCHISVDASGKFVLVANYFEVVTSFAIQENGGLSEALSSNQHLRTLPEAPRQETGHPHMVLPAFDSMVFVTDLGLDSIFHYQLSDEGGLRLIAKTPTATAAGPRHMEMHPNNKWAYVFNELNRTVEVFQVKDPSAPFERIQTIATLSNDDARVTAAAIHLHPNGKFLYTSNRGLEDSPTQSISTFSINPDDGTLQLIQETDTKGKIPRDFAISPSGYFLLVANQDTDNIIVFNVDPETGSLKDTGLEIQLPMPVCLKFW